MWAPSQLSYLGEPRPTQTQSGFNIIDLGHVNAFFFQCQFTVGRRDHPHNLCTWIVFLNLFREHSKCFFIGSVEEMFPTMLPLIFKISRMRCAHAINGRGTHGNIRSEQAGRDTLMTQKCGESNENTRVICDKNTKKENCGLCIRRNLIYRH